jgi:hypothetical protein
MNPHNCTQLIFDKVAKSIQWRKDSLFNKFVGKSGQLSAKFETRSCVSPCTSINLKWIKDLNIRPQTLKLVQERVGNTLEVIGLGKDFLNRIPAA